MTKRKTWLFACILTLHSCQPGDGGDNAISVDEPSSSTALNIIPELGRDGKVINAPQFEEVYQKLDLDALGFPVITSQTIQGLDYQLKLLNNPKLKKSHRIGNLKVHVSDLRGTIEILKSRQQTLPIDLSDYLDAYQIWGGDRRGHVKFTGYFTPLIKVSKNKTGHFKYPIYARPKNWEGQFPSRKEIEHEGALSELGLELAYAANKVDIYYMQVQGSGLVEYTDGKRELFSYNGTNRHPYRSIELFIRESAEIELSNLSIDGIKRYLRKNPELVDTVLFHNPSYTFFIAKKSAKPIGAGTVPLIADFSIAVDKKYIPLGSCLLAAFPVFDKKAKRVLRYEYKLLGAQDVGGVIKGPGHIDYYFGTGDKAKRNAGYLNHYGQLWLLLPKQQIGPVFTSN